MRRKLVRGIQFVVVVTLFTFGYLIWDGIRAENESVLRGLQNMKPWWLLIAAICALQEGVCGGLRIWVLARVLSPKLDIRTGIISEFVLMFCAGVTPGQIGAAPAQVGVLMNSGMRFADIATAELLVASCTVVFFLTSAVALFVLRDSGLLVVSGAEHLDWLLWLSLGGFGTALAFLVLGATQPKLLHFIVMGIARLFRPVYSWILRLLGRFGRLDKWSDEALSRRGRAANRILAVVDEFHLGFVTYLRRGKRAYATALLLTFGFFCSRFLVAYFILLGLGIPTTPSTFVAIGPPVLQVLFVQALLNFALYLSPTPGASGIAEAGSNTLMSPWVKGAVELPYLVVWRLLAQFLCMFVGGIYVFRYLGTDVLEQRTKEAEDERRKADEERLAAKTAQPQLVEVPVDPPSG